FRALALVLSAHELERVEFAGGGLEALAPLDLVDLVRDAAAIDDVERHLLAGRRPERKLEQELQPVAGVGWKGNRLRAVLVLVGDRLRLPVEARPLGRAPGALVAVLERHEPARTDLAAALAVRGAEQAEEAPSLPRFGELVLARVVLQALVDLRDDGAVARHLVGKIQMRRQRGPDGAGEAGQQASQRRQQAAHGPRR